MEIDKISNPSQAPDFYLLPYQLYEDHKGYVPQLISEERKLLDPRNHPFFSHSEAAFYLARDGDGKAVGRIAAIENTRHNEYHDEEIGFFGFLDAVDDERVIGSLLDRAGQWVQSRGLTAMRGPANYSCNESWGLLVQGHQRRVSVMNPYSPPYLQEHIESRGLQKEKDLYAYSTNREMFDIERTNRLVERFRDRTDLRLRTMDMSRYEQEVRVIRKLYEECWQDQWGFVPPTEEEFQEAARGMKQIVDPELVLFLENESGEEVGFKVGLPDVHEPLSHLRGSLLSWRAIPFFWNLYVTGISRLRVLLLGVQKKYRGGGTLWLMKKMVENALEKGYKRAELSWVLEDNEDMIKVAESVGSELVATYRLYETDWVE